MKYVLEIGVYFLSWFRAVEKNAPWVNKIYLITDNQIPAWLNFENPKIQVISHQNYIPEKYLPTFNSNVIGTYDW
ncbi:hypothetical protein ACL36S_16760 [Lactiplantibacillus plantarum]